MDFCAFAIASLNCGWIARILFFRRSVSSRGRSWLARLFFGVTCIDQGLNGRDKLLSAFYKEFRLISPFLLFETQHPDASIFGIHWYYLGFEGKIFILFRKLFELYISSLLWRLLSVYSLDAPPPHMNFWIYFHYWIDYKKHLLLLSLFHS